MNQLFFVYNIPEYGIFQIVDDHLQFPHKRQLWIKTEQNRHKNSQNMQERLFVNFTLRYTSSISYIKIQEEESCMI